jgi:hypothetical protein
MEHKGIEDNGNLKSKRKNEEKNKIFDKNKY